MSVIVIWREGQAGTCETHAENCQDVKVKFNKGFSTEGIYPNAETAANEFFSDFIPDEMTEEEAFDQINAYPCTK
jgi:hypothetical protein